MSATDEAALLAAVREIRETVGDQLHDLVIERQSLGSHEELVEAVRHIGRIGQQLSQARGREIQAREMGLAVSRSLSEQADALALLRSAVMSLGATCGAWVVKLDFDARRSALEAMAANGRGRRRQSEEERI